ncbi:hypothetical protein SEVIR_1G239451v4 [Setaria viridis]
MLTGKRPTDPMFTNGLNIVNFVERSLPDQIFDIVDAPVQGECETFAQKGTLVENRISRCLLTLLQLAIFCTFQSPRERANMREVASKLRSIKTSHTGAKNF